MGDRNKNHKAFYSAISGLKLFSVTPHSEGAHVRERERNLGGEGKKDSRRALEVGSSWKLSAEMQTVLDKKAIRSGKHSNQVLPVSIFNALGYRVAHS